MTEFLSFSFVRMGLMAAVIIGATCSLIGVFVVLRGMSYVGAGISHGCLAGVALALLLGWHPMLLSVIATLIMVFFIEILGRKASLKMDASIGVIFSLAMAFAVLFIGMMRRYTQDIMSYLFGNLLQVTPADLWAGLAVGLLVSLVIALFYKEIQFSTFDPEMAEVSTGGCHLSAVDSFDGPDHCYFLKGRGGTDGSGADCLAGIYGLPINQDIAEDDHYFRGVGGFCFSDRAGGILLS